MSAADCQALLTTLYNRYNQRNPSAKAESRDWTLFHWETGARVSLSIIYNGTSNRKNIQVYGRPALKRFLDGLARYGAGHEDTFESDGSSFTFTFTAGKPGLTFA